MTEVTQPTEIATLPPAERAVIALGSSKAEEQIKEFLAEAKDVTTVTDKAGRELAHKVGMKLKNARTSIEKIGKAAREDAQAFSKAVIEEEKRLKGLMAEEEERVFKLRDEFDAKEKSEKEAKERAERERVAAIQAKIDAIRALPAQSINDGIEDLEATIADLNALAISDEDYQELAEEAAKARQQAMIELGAMLDSAKAREAAAAAVAEERARLQAEADRLAAEREELERMRAELEAMKAAKDTDPAEVPPVDTGTTDLFDTTTGTIEVVENVATASPDLKIDVGTIPAGTVVTQELVNEMVSKRFGSGDDRIDGEQIMDQTVEQDADALVRELATFTSLQFMAMAKKVAAVMPDDSFSSELAGIGKAIAEGVYNVQLKAADWTAMADADKEMALASHACVSMILGDDAMGTSTLREAIAA